jgi:hypothetical protein
MAALLGRAAWLQRAGLEGSVTGSAPCTASDVDATLTGAAVASPLAVTRAWLVTRDAVGGALVGITLHYDACPDLTGLGRQAPAPKP